MAATNQISGKVKWFNVKKGYGFITPSTGGEDIFVHQTAIHAEGFRSLAEGEEVFFEISENGGHEIFEFVSIADHSQHLP
mmetsp:Transcript_21868/g.59881  ORF Transcript_21868/g.59881 Transcript_21868/m.59881 type:complete len:80 (-) Transcript_21868:175-414(-)